MIALLITAVLSGFCSWLIASKSNNVSVEARHQSNILVMVYGTAMGLVIGLFAGYGALSVPALLYVLFGNALSGFISAGAVLIWVRRNLS